MVQLFVKLPQKHEKCSCNRPFGNRDISLLHFLLRVRKETGWEMWEKCRRWGCRLSEVILWDRNQAEGRFCIRCAAANLSSDASGRTPALAVPSTATSGGRTQILKEHLRGNKQPRRQKKKFPKHKATTADATSFELRNSFRMFPL